MMSLHGKSFQKLYAYVCLVDILVGILVGIRRYNQSMPLQKLKHSPTSHFTMSSSRTNSPARASSICHYLNIRRYNQSMPLQKLKHSPTSINYLSNINYLSTVTSTINSSPIYQILIQSPNQYPILVWLPKVSEDSNWIGIAYYALSLRSRPTTVRRSRRPSSLLRFVEVQ
jgi:hypothetical protein